jgi:hypothetical protein
MALQDIGVRAIVENLANFRASIDEMNSKTKSYTDQATSGFKAAQFQIDTFAQSIGTSSTKIGLAMAASGAAITASLGLMGKSAIAEDINIKRLATTMENAGVSYDSVRVKLEALIATTQRKTGVADNDQRDILNRLILTTGNYAKSVELLPTVLDLAAAGEMDATTAATYLGKAFIDLQNGAEQVSVRFGQASLQFKNMEEIQKRVGGQSEALVDPFNVLKASIGDIGEALGTVLIPTMKGGIDVIVDFAIMIKDLAEAHPLLTKVVILSAGAAGLLLTAVGGLILLLPVLATVQAGATAVMSGAAFATAAATGKALALAGAHTVLSLATWGATNAMRAFNVAVKANPVGLIVTVVLTLVAALVTYMITTLGAKKATESLNTAIDDYEPPIDTAIAKTEAWKNALIELGRIQKNTADIESQSVAITKRLTEETEKQTQAALRQVNSAKSQFDYDGTTQSLIKMTDANGNYVDSMQIVPSAVNGATKANELFAQSLLDKEVLADWEKDWLKAYQVVIDGTIAANKILKDQQQAIIDEQTKLSDALTAFGDTITNIGKAWDYANTKAGKLGLTMNDMIGYLLANGYTVDQLKAKYELYGDDIQKWADGMSVSLEDVSLASKTTSGSMILDAEKFTSEAKKLSGEYVRDQKSALDKVLSDEKSAYQERIDNIDKILQAQLDAYDEEIIALNDQLREIDGLQKESDDNLRKSELETAISSEYDLKKKADLNRDLDELILNSNNESWQKQRQIDLEGLIANENDADVKKNIQDEYNQYLIDLDIETQRTTLENQINAVEDKKTLAQEEADFAKDIEDKKLIKFAEDIETQKAALDTQLAEAIVRYNTDLANYKAKNVVMIEETIDFVKRINEELAKIQKVNIERDLINRDVVSSGGSGEMDTSLIPSGTGIDNGPSWDDFGTFAKGGKITKPMWALLGEGGEDEYIVPESKLGSFISKILGSQSQTQKMIMPSGGAGNINNSRSTNYNIKANYSRPQDPQSLRLDLEAIAMMARS